MPSGESYHPRYGHDNDDGEVEEYTQGSEIGTRKEKGTKDGKGKAKGNRNRKGNAMEERKGKGKENGQGNGIFKKTTGGADISCAVDLQLQKKMY